MKNTGGARLYSSRLYSMPESGTESFAAGGQPARHVMPAIRRSRDIGLLARQERRLAGRRAAVRARWHGRGPEHCDNRLSYSNIGDCRQTLCRRRVRAGCCPAAASEVNYAQVQRSPAWDCRVLTAAQAASRCWPAALGRCCSRRGSVADAFAQTGYVPYYGKNRIRYDNFRWHIYTTDHFEIYYYPEIEQHLERVTSYAESAYQQVSSDLKHDLAFKVPLVLFKTQASSSSRTSSRANCPKACSRSPSRIATAWCCRSTSRPTRSTG